MSTTQNELAFGGTAWLAELARRQRLRSLGFRCFHLRFTAEHMRRGRRITQHIESDGVCFPSGHVVLDTDELERKGYESMTDMMESLGLYGTVTVEDVGGVSV